MSFKGVRKKKKRDVFNTVAYCDYNLNPCEYETYCISKITLTVLYSRVNIKS